MALVKLPQNLLTNAGTLREDFETTVGWAVNSGALANDAVHYKVGTQSLQITSTVGGTGQITKPVGPWTLSDSEAFRLWFYTDDPTKILTNSMYIRMIDVTLTKAFTHYCHVKNFGGWNLATMRQSDWTVIGGMTWATPVAYLSLYVPAAVGQQAVVSFDGFYSDVESVPALAFTFDDARASDYTVAYSYMHPRNILGTSFIVSDYINGAGRLTETQIAEMAAGGWSFGNHSKSHTDFTTLTEAQIEASLVSCRDALVGWGIGGNTPYYVSYPFGNYDMDVLNAMSDTNMLTGRTGDVTWYPALPFDEPYKLPLDQAFGSAFSLAQAKTWLDTAITNNELAVALFHEIVSGASGAYEWDITDFRAFVDYVVSLEVPCITIEETYRLQTRSVWARVPGIIPITPLLPADGAYRVWNPDNKEPRRGTWTRPYAVWNPQ